jgi:hypothetical protein
VVNEGTMRINRSTFSGNTAQTSAGGLRSAGRAAGLEANLTLLLSAVRDNHVVDDAAGVGGGVQNDARSTLELTQSTVSGNRATRGGGIANAGRATIYDDTVSGNGTAALAGEGGALLADGGTTTIFQSTIADNAAGATGGIVALGGSAAFSQTIVSGNRSNDIRFAWNTDCRAEAGTLVGSAYTVIGRATGCPAATIVGGYVVNSSRTFVDVLGPLANNGGLTATHALLPGSIALDGGPGPLCGLATDQRELTRPQDGDGDGIARCDIGAFEQQTPLAQPLRLQALNPDARPARGPGFTLTIRGTGFLAGSIVRWNGAPRPTFVVGATVANATIPASDLAVGGALTTAFVTVSTPGGATSEALPLTITGRNVAAVQGAVAQPGQSAVAASGAAAPAASAMLFVNPPATTPATLTVARYAGNPTPGTIFAGGGFVDLRVTGAHPGDALAARFYYPATITGAMEAAQQLLYWTGSAWAPVHGSIGSDPVKDTTDNLDGTTSGGRFSVTLDATSTPKITEVGGTVFTAAPSASQMVAALRARTVALVSNPTLQTLLTKTLDAAAAALPAKPHTACRAVALYSWGVWVAPTVVLPASAKVELLGAARDITRVLSCDGEEDGNNNDNQN